MTAIDIRLFGSVRVAMGGPAREIDIAPSVQILLAYLLLNRTVAHSRERLLDALWPDVEPGLARSRLSTTIWRLRRQLGTSSGEALVLSNAGGDLHLNSAANLSLDVAEFEEAAVRFLQAPAEASTAPIDSALALCSQELMEGHYCDWVETERCRLLDLKERCLSRLVERHAQAGRDEEAIARARDLLALDPLREDAHRAVMAAQIRLGRPHLARQQYDRCRDIVAAELGVEPVTETRELCPSPPRPVAVPAATTATVTTARPVVRAGVPPANDRRPEILAIRNAIAVAENQLREISRRLDDLLSDQVPGRSVYPAGDRPVTQR
jgi:DNA-binding SARP family transcriptional activator